MRVGLVCPYDMTVPGGVAAQVEGLARRLATSGEEVLVAAPSLPPGLEGREVGHTVRVRANGSVAPITLHPRAIGRVRTMLEAVDVVHVHEPLVPLSGWAALATPQPKVATFHADPSVWARRLYRLGAPLGRWALGNAEVTAVSPTAGEALAPGWGPIRIIPNGIDIAAYGPGAGRDGDLVCFVGRDEPRKGLDLLLAAWAGIRRRHAAARLMVVGAQRPQPVPGVTFLGRVSEEQKRTALASAAVFVAPHTGGESFGIAVAEAMASGCAVVASDLPAFRALVGAAGVVVPVGDPAALAEAVTGLLSDPAQSRRLGDAAREAVRPYDWAVVVSAYRRAYESALGGA